MGNLASWVEGAGHKFWELAHGCLFLIVPSAGKGLQADDIDLVALRWLWYFCENNNKKLIESITVFLPAPIP